MAGQAPVVSFLEIDGKLLSGEEFDEYCKDHGLCRRCAKVRTHRRVVKLFGKGKKWEPLTLHDEETGDYVVYKGYCLQPTCYTLGQAKRLLGEGANGAGGRRTSGRRKSRMSDRFKRRRSSRRGSGDGADSVADADDVSVASDMSGMSTSSTRSSSSILSGIGRRFRRRKSRQGSNASSASSVSSIEFSDDDTVDSTALEAPVLEEGQLSPIVEHRIEQLITYDYFTVLDLSKVELRAADIDALADALRKAQTIENITLDKCKIRDEGCKKIAEALFVGKHNDVKKLSLRQNMLGTASSMCLGPLLEIMGSLEELDLSENNLGSNGAQTVIKALKVNPRVKIHTLNLSNNEIWDLDDGSFLSNNTTLKVLQLDGNYLHDEGAEVISRSIATNHDAVIEKLLLGWNGISDDGATALAKMMETNATLQVLGLAENDITNMGARSILSSLSINTSVREISGLYHNQIDRKFIIVAIKRLLHRYGERGIVDQPDDAPMEAKETPAEEIDDDDDKSENSINWASQMYTADKESEEMKMEGGHDEPPKKVKQTSTVALEAIEHWDWGTFGIEEIEAAGDSFMNPAVDDTNLQMDFDDESEEEADLKPLPTTDGPLPSDRLTVFQSAPLAYFNRRTAEHHEIPLLDYEYEAGSLKLALEDSEKLGSDISIDFQVATTDQLSVFFSQKQSRVLHFTTFGSPDYITLENRFGYMQALQTNDLRKFVSAADGFVKVVVVCSHYAQSIAESFVKAGISHVVCCQMDAAFRDYGATEFTKHLYQELAKNNTLQKAFDAALEAVARSPLVKSARNLATKFTLLPVQSKDFHDIPVFFQGKTRPINIIQPPDTSMLPKLPAHFVGREVDMYEILESLRVDDVIRVGGAEGAGKSSAISAVARYILQRQKSFLIKNVFWLPPLPNVTPAEDSLYGDLCFVMKMLLESEDDISDDDDFVEAKERILIELEGQKNIMVIDGRQFMTEASGENLELFLSQLLNEASLKIILLTATEATSKRAKKSRSEETMITIGPMDFHSTALLYGATTKFVSRAGSPAAQTAEEFAALLVPPSIAKLTEQTATESSRQKELYAKLGSGNPSHILSLAEAATPEEFTSIIRLAKRPEITVDSAGALDSLVKRFTELREKSIKAKNFLRAQDYQTTIDELESMRSAYPSLVDLMRKERELKRDLTSALAERRYEDANSVKRKLLTLKKVIMKEKDESQRIAPAKYSATGKLAELQAQMNHMLKMAEQMNMDKSLSELDASMTLRDDSDNAAFAIAREDHTCTLRIFSGDALQPGGSPSSSRGIVVWTNENCDLSLYQVGERVLKAGGISLAKDLAGLADVHVTSFGPVKVGTGEAVILGPRSYGDLCSFIILAVSPLSPTNDDKDWDGDANHNEDDLHVLESGIRSSYRACFRAMNTATMDGVVFPVISSESTGSTYEQSLRIGLQTIADEAKFSNLSEVQLVANSAMEATTLIKMALGMGLTLSGN